VDVVQNPTKSLADDVAVTNRVLDQYENEIRSVTHTEARSSPRRVTTPT
jgi:hypothetical protein